MVMIQGFFGLVTILLIAYTFSEARKAVSFKTTLIAILIHVVLAVIFLKLPIFKEFFLLLNEAVLALNNATIAGTNFVFGYLGGGDTPFEVTSPQSSFILAFQALPLVLVISALSSLLYYYRILPAIVHSFSFLLQKSLNIGGTVGLGTAANAFVGMVESPLLIRPYLKNMTRGEIFSVMVAGMSTIAGTVMVLYATILSSKVPDALGHILTASVLNIFSALIISMLIIPHQNDQNKERVKLPQTAYSAMDAIVKGTNDGVKLLISIIAMLIVFIALVHLTNQLLAFLPEFNNQTITLQSILGIVMAPITFLMGIPVSEITIAGSLMGTKIILNEFIAYIELLNLPAGALQERSKLIMIYAMCGFANIGSLGIMIGGMTAMCDEKRDEIISLGVKSVFAGVLTTCFTATVVGLII
ncbi:nucleoside transporter C-terminal domain-containing protein [Candidatus Parabeggiatoa sp. HSG14]|uniref:NupC/NupG family nucleoside CNT transporter n=1 Tax=Candidatus Parabeggiatoa sp. HSG14 TaxID=3055593 RepID=UPI0025A801A5|nr:nucleoside transporter C-terminal domain-containing protein [Thiotrichales bacterium HSG14]